MMTLTSGTGRGRRLGIALAIGTLIVGSMAGYAAATGTDAPASESDRSAAKVDLSSSERAQLDRQVDAEMSKSPGATRVAVNQLAWDDGDVVLTLPLPGEKQARAVDEPIGTKDSPNCGYGSVCLYDDAFYGGRRLSFTACKLQKLRNYNFTNRTESWHNNQTTGTISQIFYWSSSAGTSFGLGATNAPSAVGIIGYGDDNRADSIRVCR